MAVMFCCCKCSESFLSHGVKQNHKEFFQGAPTDTCPYCLSILSISNMARHNRQCAQFNDSKTGHEYKEILGDKMEKSVELVVN